MKNIFKIITYILPSLIVFILGFLLYTKVGILTEQQMDVIYYAPYAILLLAAAMAWRFNRSRIFFLTLLFAVCLWVMNILVESKSLYNQLYMILCILIPFNILIFTFLKERGILSLWGILRFGMIILQAGLTHWLIKSDQQMIIDWISRSLIQVKLTPFINMVQIGFIAYILVFIVFIIRTILFQTPQEITYLSVLISLFFMFNSNKPVLYSIFFTVIGLILVLSILRDSYSMAFFDELTGLPSRRALNQDLMKLGMKYSIAMVDIDFFKKFNDTYGHDTGDEVLKFIASMIKEVKGGGKAYRYGGEEFTVLFPGKNSSDVLDTLDELRETIAKRAFTVRRKRSTANSSRNKSRNKGRGSKSNSSNTKKIYIHVSIGVANKDENLKNTAMVIKASDQALYRAKKKGRNCVCK